MDGKAIQNIVDQIREGAKLKNKEKCYKLLSELSKEIKENDELSYLKKEELVKFMNRAFLLFHDYDANEKFFFSVLENENLKPEKNNKYIATVLNLLGELYYYMGDFDSAEEKYNESLEIREIEFGIEHPLTIECKSNLALLLTERGRFREAENMYNTIIPIYEKESEKYMEEYLYTLLNNGLLYRKWGKYSQAINNYLYALDLVGVENYQMLRNMIINNIGVLYLETGSFIDSEIYLEEAYSTCMDLYGLQHIHTITYGNNLAFSKLHMGKTTEARQILEKILKRIPDALKQHPNIIKVKTNLSSIYMEDKGFLESENLINEILSKKNYFVQSEAKIVAKMNLAKMQIYKECYDMSVGFLDELLVEQSSVFGSNTIQYTKILTLKSLALIQLKNYTEATKELQKAVDIQNEILYDVSTSFSRDYAWNFLYRIADDINIYLSFFAEKGEETGLSTEQLYNTILKRKGIVFETNIERYKNILNEKNPVLRDQYDELIKLKEEIILRTTKGYFKEAKEGNENRIKELNEQISLIENKISAAIPAYKFEKKIKDVSLKMLQEKLEKETLFVDFFKFRRFDFETPQNKFTGESYIIFYVDNHSIQYEIIEDARSLDKKIRQTDVNRNPDGRGMSAESDEGLLSNEQILSQIYNAVLNGLDKDDLNKYSRLCISSDGEFSKIPFETLLNEEGKYLIEDFEIYYVSSGRHIIKSAGQKSEKRSADNQKDVTLFANPEFYIKSEKKDDSDKSPGHFRGTSTVFRNELDEFPPLPGTREEVDAINTLIDKNRVKSINMYFDKAVNDSEIKKIDSPLILHLATHGFYLDTRKDIHPFSRCGIALSGVNNMLRGEELEPWLEDGLLTATDSLSLKLINTELVILSACRTGVGEVRNGEGVLGLSSAFLCAGASSVILSLWNVPDFFTVELMTTFYEGIFAGYTKSRSLREAKLKMIRKLRSEWGEAPTWIWGGFILFGDNHPIFS